MAHFQKRREHRTSAGAAGANRSVVPGKRTGTASLPARQNGSAPVQRQRHDAASSDTVVQCKDGPHKNYTTDDLPPSSHHGAPAWYAHVESAAPEPLIIAGRDTGRIRNVNSRIGPVSLHGLHEALAVHMEGLRSGVRKVSIRQADTDEWISEPDDLAMIPELQYLAGVIAPEHSVEGATIPEPLPAPDWHENVARLKLHVRTAGRVGHTWLELKYPPGAPVSDELRNQCKPLHKVLTRGEERAATTFGFYPENEERILGKVAGIVEIPDPHSGEEQATQTWEINHEQVLNLAGYVDANMTHRYELLGYNCTTFAIEACRAAGVNPPSGTGSKGLSGIFIPAVVYASLKKRFRRHRGELIKFPRKRPVDNDVIELVEALPDELIDDLVQPSTERRSVGNEETSDTNSVSEDDKARIIAQLISEEDE